MKQEQLLKKAQKGSDDAFIELLQEEKIKLYKMAYIFMKNENQIYLIRTGTHSDLFE